MLWEQGVAASNTATPIDNNFKNCPETWNFYRKNC